VIEDVVFIISKISEMIYPFLPDTAEKIQKQIETKEKEVIFPKIV
jgi:methionyl-tRNA synthetase